MQKCNKSLVLTTLITLFSSICIYSQNLIVNGDFESGGNGVGFITDGAGYSELLAPFSGTTVSGNFALATNPISVNSSIFINAGDHTTGSGKMLIVDGNTTAGSPRFWKAGNAGSGICGLTIGTSYTFSYWVKSISTTVTNASTQAGIGISFTGAGSIVPTPFSSVVPLPASGWKQVVYTFKATATCVSIELWNNNVNATGNDFAVDDFSLTGPQPLSLNYTSQSPTCPGLSNGSISGFGIGGVLPYANYTLTGIIPVVASITNSTGIFTGLSAGTYSLSIKDAVNTVITQNNIVLTTPTDLTVSSGVTNCSSTSTALSVSGGSSGYTWTASPSDPTLTTPNVSNPTVSPTQTTIYTVTSSSVITNDELIYNGDFSLGNVGFSTDYKYLVVSPGAQGRYGITTNANSYWSGFQPCVERLSPGVGKMMVADGSIVNGGNDRVWCQTVAVKPGQNYVFSYWSESIQSATLANIEVLINGVSIAPPASTGGVCNWLKKTINWSSGVSTTAEICIYDRSIISAGNDFAIDDISFKESSATCNLSKSVTVTIPNPINLIITNPSFVCSPGSVDITQPSITAGSTTGTVISYWRDAAGTVPLLNPNSITLSGTYYIKSTIAPCSVIKPVVVDILTNNTISLSSGVGTNAQTVSINTPITTITYNTTGATGATFLGLPSGVNGVWSANTVTISGTPSVSVGSPYSYTVTLTGGCGIISTTGTISVNPNNTISLSSAVGTNAQTVCINAPITTITYTTTGATGATFLGLPSGVNGVWSANTVTISGTPSVSVGSPYTYTVTLTGGAGTISTTGTISVNLNNTVSLSSAVASDAQTVCINAPIANITYTTTGATGATFLGLPSGVNGVWSANTVTISGTPSVSVGSPYSYTVTLTGGCGTVSTTGTISVDSNNTISLSSAVGTNAQTVCINAPIANITYTTTGATGATFLGLPSGVNGVWSANTVTISGTPSVSVGSPYTYTVTLTGGCGTVSTTGTISVNPNNTISLSSAVGTNAQTVCINAPIANITYTTTGATGATFIGLPSGVNGVWSANTVTISGTPSVSVGSPYTYTVTLTGGCGIISTTGTISINSAILAPLSGGDVTECGLSPIQTLTATSTAPTGSTLVWYDAATGGSVVASPTLNSIGTVTYYSESVNSATNCSSSTRTPVILTINAAPIQPISGGDITECEVSPIQTLTATATAPTGSTLVWYDAATGGSIIASPTLNSIGTVTYYAESVNSTTNCPSLTRIAVTLTINPLPLSPTSVGDITECELSPIQTLTATSTAPTGSTLVWYDAATGGSVVASPTLNSIGTVTYYSESVNSATNCSSSTRTPVILTINAAPIQPISGGDITECEVSPIQTLTATATAPTGSTLVWYDAATGGSIIASPTLNSIGTVTYYAESVNSTTNCPSLTRIAVTLTINPLPLSPTSVGDITECELSPIQTLTAGATAPLGSTVVWYDAATGGSVVASPTLNSIGTVTYYSESVNSATNCSSSTRTPVILTINAAPIQPISGGDITECEVSPIQTLTATATAPTGSTLVWYDAATGGSIIASPTLNSIGTVTYYAESVNSTTNCPSLTRIAVTLTINPLPLSPTSVGDITECELSPIQTLTATSTAPLGSTVVWYDAATGGSVVASPTLNSIGTVTYYSESVNSATNCSSSTRTPVILTINAAPIQPISGGDITECEVSPIQTLTATATAPTGSTLVWYDAATGGSIIASPTLNSIGTVTYYAESVNSTTNCPSLTRIAVTLTINPLPLSPTSVGDITECELSPIQTLTAGATAPLGSTVVWYDAATGGSVVASPTLNSIGTVTYHAESVNSATNCSSSTRTPVILTISKAPIAGTVTGNQEICTALTTSFKTDSLESGVWSSSDVLIATVDSSTGVVTGVGAGTATITYTVVGTGGCLDAKATRTVTVTAAPVVGTLSGTQAICVGLTTTFSSTTLGGTWSSSDVSVATIDSSTGLITGVGAGVATMTYNVTGTGGCSDVSDIRTVTVTAAPNAGTLDGVQNICAALTTTFTTDSLESGVWSSSDALIATVDSSTGVVIGVGAGTATITYTVAGTGGCFDAKATRTVTVTAAPVAGTLSGTQAICEGLTTTFSSTTLGGTWSSSDVSVATIDSSTGLVTGVGAGTASMVYTVEGNGGCSNVSDALAITVNANDTPLFTSVPPVCYGATISVLPTTSDNGITGTWSPTLNNTKTTTYKFTPTLGLCAVPTTLEIVVLPLPIITATPSLKEICSNTSPNIELKSDISGTTFDWTVVQTNITGATNSSGDSINQTLSAVSNDKGEALYTITPTANGCQGASITAKIIVNPIPTVSTTGNEPICSGNTTNISLTGTVIGTTFSWNAVSNKVLGAFSSTGSKIVQTLKTATNVQGSVDYSIVPLSNGCIGSPTLITVVVNPVPEVFGSSKTTICSGDSTNIILSPSIVGTQFDWTVSQDGVTGASLGTGDLIQQTLVAGKTLGSATYTITPTVGGCSGTSIKIKINVNPSPMPEIEDGIICVTSDTGETLKSYLLDTQLSNSTYDFKWYFDDEEIVGASQNKYEATDTGVYSVIATNTITSCVSDEKKVTVVPNYPADSFTVAVSDAFTQNATITVTVQGGTGPYFYQLDNGLEQVSTVFTNVNGGEHTITVTDEQGCTSESQKITIIDYPKYFTPNGDGYNDRWNIGGLTNTNIDIYDRYGKLIKQINTSSLGWDGTFNGQLLPATDYWFTVEYIEPNTNATKIFKSHFSLKR